MKQALKDNLFFICTAIGVLVMTIWLCYIYDVTHRPMPLETAVTSVEAKPDEFKVGQCFTWISVYTDQEPWEGEREIYRVEEVGIRRYRCSLWRNNGWAGVERDTTYHLDLTIRKQSDLKRVDCPKEK